MAVVFKGVGTQVARIAGENGAMDVAANLVAAKARGFAASHGSLPGCISTERTRGKRGVTDRLVTMDHEAAVSIEFGHMTRGGRSYVEGLHIMGRAAGVR